MSDLVKQLRVTENSKHFDPYTRDLAGGAADEIERLQAELVLADRQLGDALRAYDAAKGGDGE